MAVHIIIDTVTGDRLKIDTWEHDADSLADTIAREFFPPLIDGQVLNPESMRAALADLSQDIMSRMLRPGPAEYLGLRVV